MLLASSRIKEISPTGKRNSVQMGGGCEGMGVSACSRVCVLAWNRILGMYPYFILFLLSNVHPADAQKYQHVLGFGADDIFSCLLVINQKMWWGTFWECHMTGVTKHRFNTMFWMKMKVTILISYWFFLSWKKIIHKTANI